MRQEGRGPSGKEVGKPHSPWGGQSWEGERARRACGQDKGPLGAGEPSMEEAGAEAGGNVACVPYLCPMLTDPMYCLARQRPAQDPCKSAKQAKECTVPAFKSPRRRTSSSSSLVGSADRPCVWDPAPTPQPRTKGVIPIHSTNIHSHVPGPVLGSGDTSVLPALRTLELKQQIITE